MKKKKHTRSLAAIGALPRYIYFLPLVSVYVNSHMGNSTIRV